MPREVSVAVSDLAVALSAFYCAVSLEDQWSKAGFTMIGVAASIGIVRFGSERPPEYLRFTHVSASWIAKLFGMPCISIAYLHATKTPVVDYEHYLLIAAIVTFLVTKFLPRHMKSTPTDVVSGLAVIGIVIHSYHARLFGILGAVGYFLGGVALEVDLGKEFMSPVALFHYIISAANLFLMLGLTT